MEATLQNILAELQEVRRQIQDLKNSRKSNRRIIESMLRRRGVNGIKYTSPDHIVLPEDCSQETEDTFYHLMKKYSFRIFLRDLIRHIKDLKPDHLTRYCSEEVAQQYLTILVQHHILQYVSSWQYKFTAGKVRNFGDTLEWFVAQVMRREFVSPATWGNRLKNRNVGGDYDVIAAVENRFTYIEVKSSPPKHIDIPEVTAFVDRIQSLRPDFAIFLEDTHLRMKDKLVVMFQEEMQRRYDKHAEWDYAVQRLQDEIFTINNIIFISNTKPDLISNIGICLKHVFARGL